MPIPQVSSVEQPSYTDDSVAMNDEYEYYDVCIYQPSISRADCVQHVL